MGADGGHAERGLDGAAKRSRVSVAEIRWVGAQVVTTLSEAD